jgi:hypothetical protein
MSDTKRLLITASLNIGSSVGEINNAIKKIQKHQSLQKIKIKIDVDQKILKTLTDFNNNLTKINQTMGQQSNISDKVTQSINNRTKAIEADTKAVNQATMAQKQWNIEKKEESRLPDNPDGSKGDLLNTKTTYGTGNRLDNSQKIEFTKPSEDGLSTITNSPVKYVENAKADEIELEKLRKEISARNLADEKARHDSFKSQTKEKFDLLNETSQKNLADEDARHNSFKRQTKEKFETTKKNLADEKARHDSFVAQQKDGYKLANQMADGKNKEQEKFAKMEAKAQENRIKASHRMAETENKSLDSKRVQLTKDITNEIKKQHDLKSRLAKQDDQSSLSSRAIRNQILESNNALKSLEQTKLRVAGEEVKSTLTQKQNLDIARTRKKLAQDQLFNDAKITEQQRKEMDDGFVRMFKRRKEESETLKANQQRAIYDNHEREIKMLDQAHLMNDSHDKKRYIREQNFQRMKLDAQAKLDNARLTHGHHGTVTGRLDGASFDLSKATTADDLKKINTQIRSATAGFKAMRHESIGFIDGFKTAMVKFPIWMAAATAKCINYRCKTL